MTDKLADHPSTDKMVQITTLTLLATGVLTASAVDIDFRRFSSNNCDETYHIRKDTNLHDPHCKTFSDHEPPFTSFIVDGDDDMDDLEDKMCSVTVYDSKDCNGREVKFTGMSSSPFHSLLHSLTFPSPL
jgi:hypothetical protein